MNLRAIFPTSSLYTHINCRSRRSRHANEERDDNELITAKANVSTRIEHSHRENELIFAVSSSSHAPFAYQRATTTTQGAYEGERPSWKVSQIWLIDHVPCNCRAITINMFIWRRITTTADAAAAVGCDCSSPDHHRNPRYRSLKISSTTTTTTTTRESFKGNSSSSSLTRT